MNPIPKPITVAKFNKLSPVERRKAIGRDVIARLDVEQIKPTTGSYFYFNRYDDEDETDVQKRLKSGHICTVCALGAAVVAIAAIEDKIEVNCNGELYLSDDKNRDDGSYTIAQRVKKIMGNKLTAIMETAFEGNPIVGMKKSKSMTPEISDACISFHHNYEYSDSRFRAIWEQIAATGTFDPTK